MNNTQNQTLALAGIFQSAQLILQLASTGTINQPAYEASLDTLFRFENQTTLDVFGDLPALITGFKTILSFDKNAETQPNEMLVYYVLSMMKLGKKLARNTKLMNEVQKGLEKVHQQSHQYDFSVSSISSKVDLLYQETISNIKPRIMVRGDEHHLSSTESTNKVRTLLFCGIRSAFLWQQLGGSKWKLIFSKKSYIKQSADFLSDVQV